MKIGEGHEGIVAALCMLFTTWIAVAVAKLVFGY
jgi:hypothetical protein